MNRRGVASLIMVLLTAALAGQSACRRGRVLAGPPVTGNGVRIALDSARAKGDSVDIWLTAYSDLDEEVVVNRNQIAVVGPDGRDQFRAGGREIHRIPPRGQHAIHIDIDGRGLDYQSASGIHLRFDGLYVGDIRIQVPPMALGNPTAGPGEARAALAPPPEEARAEARPTEEPGLFRRVFNAVTKQSSQTEQAPSGTHVQSYRGPRRRLRNPGLKCAAMPLKAKEVPESMAFIMDELLLTELQNVGFEAIGQDDINALVGLEKVKDAVGCDELSCVAELGMALGVAYLAAGNVAALDSSTVLTLKLIDVNATRVVARVNRIANAGKGALPRLIAEAVQELVKRSEL